MKRRRLPLGIDLGASRVRVALLERGDDGRLHLLRAVASEVEDDVPAALVAALDALGSKDRNCALTIRACDARMRVFRFPKMPAWERERAARLEGTALFAELEEPIAVGHASAGERTLVAAAPLAVVRERIRFAAQAGLRVRRVDHEALALARVARLPLLDIGSERSTLVFESEGMPEARTIPYGGRAFSAAMAREYGTSFEIAEARKRTIGLGGAAADTVAAFVRSLDAELRELRSSVGLDVRSVTLTGNGSRLAALERALRSELALAAAPVELGDILVSGLPQAVDRAGAVDWLGAIAAAA